MALFHDALSRSEAGGWTPNVDMYQTPSGWVVKFDLAGVEPEDVTLKASGSELSVSGIRRDRAFEAGWRHYAMEISYSRFHRHVELPCYLDACTLTLSWKQGMLLVEIREESS